jgi:hypothetical protein
LYLALILLIVNYDTEYDKLRRIFLSLINDILSETEPSLQRILYQNMGNLSVFFGRKMTIDNLIPLSNSCFNKKDFMLRVSYFYFYNIFSIDGMFERYPLFRFESRLINTGKVSPNNLHSFII